MARIPIPNDVASDVLFGSDRTCCVCNVPGKPVQLHHIDEAHSNNEPENLAVLCLECHHSTQLRGGFARHLDAAQVRVYRADWLARIRRRRDESDRIAIEAMVGLRPTVLSAEALETLLGADATADVGSVGAVIVNERLDGVEATAIAGIVTPAARDEAPIPLVDYVRSLPALRRQAYVRARPEWESGVTARMVDATYQTIDVLEDALVKLAQYYPEGHFDGDNPRDYFSELIATRFRWHRNHHEPDGRGQNGTIVQPMIARSALADVEQMVEDMVNSLTLDWSASVEDDTSEGWQREWDAASEN